MYKKLKIELEIEYDFDYELRKVKEIIKELTELEGLKKLEVNNE